MITISIILFIAGILFLLLYKLEEEGNDIMGFGLIITAYIVLLLKLYYILHV